ncbi:hypothetical protein O6H91_07G027900 [Diphasiastrum complanatum]|uniref:Uncharacterized protein n=1 Tax=Diphasiastrum complanatum TaxID=34168 RepID=A0ACC2D3J4_DIPCM|nr:hypothetical protein O6H91_07G027900 [Diphasiastrum complanatum]
MLSFAVHHVLSSSSLRVCSSFLEESCGRIRSQGNTCPARISTALSRFEQNMFEAGSISLRGCKPHYHSLTKLAKAPVQESPLIKRRCSQICTSSSTWSKLIKSGLCYSSKYQDTGKKRIDVHDHAHVHSCLADSISSKDVDFRHRFGEKQGFADIGYAGLHLILGPMFAGKTTALLRRIHAEVDAGRNVALVKSDKDTRYGINAVVSHDGIQMPCTAVPDLATFKKKLGKLYNEVEVIGIDEAQFFEDLVGFCKAAADVDGKTVIVAGLDGDFLRRKFGSAIDLIPLADTVTKLSSRCEACGQPAAFTLRKTKDLEKEVIGGADIYMPVCRRHYTTEQVTSKLASMVQDEFQALVQ